MAIVTTVMTSPLLRVVAPVVPERLRSGPPPRPQDA
jgi:hypothetical protein